MLEVVDTCEEFVPAEESITEDFRYTQGAWLYRLRATFADGKTYEVARRCSGIEMQSLCPDEDTARERIREHYRAQAYAAFKRVGRPLVSHTRTCDPVIA